MSRHVRIYPDSGDLGVLFVSSVSRQPGGHLNKFGQPYDLDTKPPY